VGKGKKGQKGGKSKNQVFVWGKKMSLGNKLPSREERRKGEKEGKGFLILNTWGRKKVCGQHHGDQAV